MTSALVLIAITVVTLFGDYFIKLASDRPEGIASSVFIMGAILYGLPAFGWFMLMKNHSLAAIGVLYSASTIVLLAGLGYFVFHETFGWREVFGVSLAIASVVVMSHS